MVEYLENQYETVSVKRLEDLNKPVNILVLGGGHTDDKRFPANNQLSETALMRLSEGIRIHRQLPGSTLITSGHSGKSEIAQAQVLANAALLLGVDASHIKMQTQPKNTWAEANEYKRLLKDSAQLVLVTSAAHMPRAMYLFKKADLNPIVPQQITWLKKVPGKKIYGIGYPPPEISNVWNLPFMNMWAYCGTKWEEKTEACPMQYDTRIKFHWGRKSEVGGQKSVNKFYMRINSAKELEVYPVKFLHCKLSLYFTG